MEQEFFTWASLGTYAGAVFATTMITQMCKNLGPLKRFPTRVFSYLAALAVLLAATFFTAGWRWADVALCAFNALIVALAANGSYDAMVSDARRRADGDVRLSRGDGARANPAARSKRHFRAGQDAPADLLHPPPRGLRIPRRSGMAKAVPIELNPAAPEGGDHGVQVRERLLLRARKGPFAVIAPEKRGEDQALLLPGDLLGVIHEPRFKNRLHHRVVVEHGVAAAVEIEHARFRRQRSDTGCSC